MTAQRIDVDVDDGLGTFLLKSGYFYQVFFHISTEKSLPVMVDGVDGLIKKFAKIAKLVDFVSGT